MRDSVPITEVRRNFGVFHDIAQTAPIPVSKHGHETVYLISAKLYHCLCRELAAAGRSIDLLQKTSELFPELGPSSPSRRDCRDLALD